jgi:hypothetical protein
MEVVMGDDCQLSATRSEFQTDVSCSERSTEPPPETTGEGVRFRRLQRWEKQAIATAWLAAIASIALLSAPVPWAVAGAPTLSIAVLDGGGYALGYTLVGSIVASLGAALCVLAPWRPVRAFAWLVAGAALVVALWMWSVVAVGTFHRPTVLFRNRDRYRGWDDACRAAMTAPTMRERRASAKELPMPPDDWMEDVACRGLRAEVEAFDTANACPRSLPTDACRCGRMEWPTQRPPCDAGVECWRIPGDAEEVSTRLECGAKGHAGLP